MVRRLFGEGDGNAILDGLAGGVESQSFTVLSPREDLSNTPSDAGRAAGRESPGRLLSCTDTELARRDGAVARRARGGRGERDR